MTEPIRVCLVGAGRAGQVHASTLVGNLPGSVLGALVDHSPDALRTAGEKFGVEARYATLEDALERAAFDAVVITTPTFTHKDLTVLAARHGKHVLCEKPMALDLAACDEMIAACERVPGVKEDGDEENKGARQVVGPCTDREAEKETGQGEPGQKALLRVKGPVTEASISAWRKMAQEMGTW